MEFTITQWAQWWKDQLGPDWINRRGCRKGQYVMARIGDKGDYTVANVQCILHSQNVKDGSKSMGETNGAAKLTEEQVIQIRQSTRTLTELANKYSVSISALSMIKSRKRWKHLP